MVIVPVDCSAGESVYHEQYAAFQLTKGRPVGITSNVTLTRDDDGEVLGCRRLLMQQRLSVIKRSSRTSRP